MSFRQSIFRPASTAARSHARYVKRSIASSSSTRAGATHDDHSHSSSSGPDDTETHETWFSRPWIKFYIFTAVTVLGYPYLPSLPSKSTSPSLDPAAFEQLKNDPNTPWITRAFANAMESRESLVKRGEDHVDACMRVAEEKILLDDAQRPQVPMMKNRYAVDQASPFGVPVGSNVKA